jgi:hypothetical protein
MDLKKTVIVFIFVVGFTRLLYGGGRYYTEAEIPMPLVQYELPQALIGEFIIVHPTDNLTITIYPNNKYIEGGVKGGNSYPSYDYGYVIKENGVYYFRPLGLQSHREPVEIPFVDQNWTFDVYYQLRTARMPEFSHHIAENITIMKMMARQQYYLVDRNNKHVPIDSGVRYFEFHYSLAIDMGVVLIYEDFKKISNTGKEELANHSIWKGILETVDEIGEDFFGRIQFANSPAFYNIVDGTASIEKTGNSIRITAVCSKEIEKEIQKKYPIQPPVYLVLEF